MMMAMMTMMVTIMILMTMMTMSILPTPVRRRNCEGRGKRGCFGEESREVGRQAGNVMMVTIMMMMMMTREGDKKNDLFSSLLLLRGPATSPLSSPVGN